MSRNGTNGHTVGSVIIIFSSGESERRKCQSSIQHFCISQEATHTPTVLADKVVHMNERSFRKAYWKESIFGDIEEEISSRVPEPLGNPGIMVCFVDANHVGEQTTCRSQTRFIIYLNTAPIDWYSKRHNTVKSSTIRSEFVAIRIAMEKIWALRYKLRMFGIC